MATLDGSTSTTQLYHIAFYNDLYTAPLAPNTVPGLQINPMHDVTCSLTTTPAGANLSSDCTSISTSATGGSGSIQVQVNPISSVQVLTRTVPIYVWEPVNVSIIMKINIIMTFMHGHNDIT